MRSGSGIRRTGPRKNEPAAMKSAVHMRQRCRLMRARAAKAAVADHPAVALAGGQREAGEHHQRVDEAGVALQRRSRSPATMLDTPSTKAATMAPRSSRRDAGDEGRTVFSPVTIR